MKVLKEFKEFINKGNVVDLAVAVVIGGAFGKIVSALVADMVMPLVNAVVPQGDWRKWEVSPLHFRLGDFLGTVVDFAIVAFVVFIIMVKIVGTMNRKVAAPETKQCPECLEMVPKAARRCRACTSVLTALALFLLSIHSARLFAGETSGATARVGGAVQPEPRGLRPERQQGHPGRSAFHDTRTTGKVGLTTTLFAGSASRADFTVRYDQNPPPRPIPPGTPAGGDVHGRIPTVLGQGRHAGRGDPDLHLHLSRSPAPPVSGASS